jgi:hypothetical protein
MRNGRKSDGQSDFNRQGAGMRVCDVGERGVKWGSYFSVMSQGTELQQKSPIYQKVYIL